jgi:predicted HicB family RNase H-like nuclease
MARTQKKKVGAPRGTVNNPQGNNQWQDIRADKPIAVRLLKEQDEAIRAKAVAEGKSLTQVMEEAVAHYLESGARGK